MPGILGLISRAPDAACERKVAAMLRSMEHEPFYRSERCSVPEMGIYAGCVTRAEQSEAGLVFVDAETNVILILAGECFSVRGAPQCAAPAAIVRLYAEQGEKFAGLLNGLFSGLLIDRRRQTAWLFNDRYGLERLYWCEHKGDLYFASEAKALLAVVPETRRFDENGVAQYLKYGCTLDGQTLFHSVGLTGGGSLWKIEQGSCRRAHYFAPSEWERLSPMSESEFEECFDAVFKRILPQYFESAARVGISLTGGLDTRMIMACVPGLALPRMPVSYTYADAAGETVDARLAKRVARECGLEHQLLRFGADFFQGFFEHFERSVFLTDGCFGLMGTHEVYMNRQARTLSPVRITGNYGSEILRSVSTFKPLGLHGHLLSEAFRKLSAGAGLAREPVLHPVTFAAFREIPWNLFGNLAAGRSQVLFRTPYLDNAIVELAYRAPRQARVSPLPALRFVARNHRALSRIPTDRGLVGAAPGVLGHLRHGCAQLGFKVEYHTNEGLPDWLAPVEGVVRHVNVAAQFRGWHKFLHYRRWLRRELADALREQLADAVRLAQPFWNMEFIGHMAEDHIQGRKNLVRELDVVLTLAAVERRLFRPVSHSN